MARQSAMSAQTMAQHNRDLVLGALRVHGALARPAIGEMIGVSPATINRLTTDLLRRGVILPAGTTRGGAGRPSLRVQLNASAGHVVVVDVGAHQDRVALVDLAGSTVRVEGRAVAPGRTGRARVQDVAGLVREALGWAGQTGLRCIGVAAGVPGVVDHDGEVTWAPTLGWHKVGLARVLSEVSGLHTVVENDANILAMAEYRHGAARGTPFMVALTLGEGVGAGIIADGRLYRGQTSAAGEIGYMLLGPEALHEPASGFGHLESRVGTDAFLARVRAALPDLAPEETWESLTQRLRGQKGPARSILQELGDELAVALGDLVAILNPGAVVLGGPLAPVAELVIPAIEARLTGRVPHVPRLLPPSLGPDAVLRGAAELVLDGVGSLDAVL